MSLHYLDKVFARGFVLSQDSSAKFRKQIKGKPYSENILKWDQHFFGSCMLWADPLLKYERTHDKKLAVGVMGLCINPFDGLSSNKKISKALYSALKKGRDVFFDEVDKLTGAFVIVYRENDRVFLLQDAAATKPIYYHRTAENKLTAVSHVELANIMLGLQADPRAEEVFSKPSYASEASKYLPGIITPYKELYPLTANHELDVSAGCSKRFFPREPLAPRPFDSAIVDEIASILIKQAKMLGKMRRPLLLAATGGRDSRVSVVAFSGQKRLSYFSFYNPQTGHLKEDVDTAKKLSEVEGVPLKIFNLSDYSDPEFKEYFDIHSRLGIWDAAAWIYVNEFPSDAIHIRSTVSEIGRVFYRIKANKDVTPERLAKIYTLSEFHQDPMVISTMKDFIEMTDFYENRMYNYDLYDMFYWEHRNAKWQNVLCSEAEMATDVFVPYNNRNLLKLFMSVPFENRLAADIHLALCHKFKPEFDEIPIV